MANNPVPTTYVTEKMSDKEVREIIRRVHVESNLWRYGTFTPNWPETLISANTTMQFPHTFAATDFRGLKVGMNIYITPPYTTNNDTGVGLVTGLVVGGSWVDTDEQITVVIGNVTTSPVTLTALGVWGYTGVLA